jgi:hypothetical protein
MRTRKNCKHQYFWIMAGGFLCWCYVCGALRKMKLHPTRNESYPVGRWIKPTGDKDNNPSDKLDPS